MQLLKERILKDGIVRDGNILSVDSFLNHQIDINLYNEIGKEFKSLFKDNKINKILTIEASGIGLACIIAQYFDVPVVFAKKSKSLNVSGDVYTADVHSYTSNKDYKVTVSKKYINENDNILIIDDFLATGTALFGLMSILEQSNAKLEGIGIIIEKGFQGGGDKIREMGINLKSLAIIDSMENNNIVFR